MKTEIKIPIIHNKGKNPCNGVAFYWDHRPSMFERVDVKYASFSDGKRPSKFDLITCENCGKPIEMRCVHPEGGFE